MQQKPQPTGFKTFLVLWITQSLSTMGSTMTLFVTTIWLTQVRYPGPGHRSELALAISLVGLARTLPVVFVTPMAGVWVDRLDRKRIMFIVNLLSTAVALLLAILLSNSGLSLWMVLLLMVVQAVLGSFHSAAFDSSYIQVVPKAQLGRANGMMQTTLSLAGVLSPALAAAIVMLPRHVSPSSFAGQWLAVHGGGTSLAILFDALSYLQAALVLPFLHVPSPSAGKRSGLQKQTIWEDLREGIAFIWHRPPLLWLLGTLTVANVVTAARQVFTPLIVQVNLASDYVARGFTFESALAIVASSASLGGVVGGMFISVWGGGQGKRVLGVIIPLICLGLHSNRVRNFSGHVPDHGGWVLLCQYDANY